MLYHKHQRIISKKSLKDALVALEKSVKNEPDNPVLIGMLASLHADGYQIGYDLRQKKLDEAFELARTAVTLDPYCQYSQWAMALNHYIRGDKKLFTQAAESVVSLNQNSWCLLIFCGVLLGLSGEIEKGLAILENAQKRNSWLPGWHRILTYMIHFIRGEYRDALAEAISMNMSYSLWESLMQAAAYGMLDLKAEAERAIQTLLKIQPGFLDEYHILLPAFVFSEENVNALKEGLRKAGLNLQ